MDRTKESYAEMLFPMRGLDVSCEYGRQPPGTAPAGVNVRSSEPTEIRFRGGSRCGLVKFLDERVNGEAEIQHLAVLVTTDPAFLLAGVTPPFDLDLFILDITADSRNPGRLVPIGGSGVWQNRNVSNNSDTNDDIEGNLIPGTIHVAGATYQVDILPTGLRSVAGLDPYPIPEGQPVIVVKAQDGNYYMQGGP